MTTTALILLLLCFAVSRLLLSRSVTSLSVEQKAMLVDASTSKRAWFFVVLAALLAVLAITSANFGHRDWLFVGFIIVLLALWIAMVLVRFRRLSALPLPPAYLRTVGISTLLVGVGLALYLAAIVYKVVASVTP